MIPPWLLLLLRTCHLVLGLPDSRPSLVPSEAVSSGLQDGHHGETVQEGHHVGLTYAAALALTSSATQEAAGLALNSTPNAASTPEAQLA